MDKSSNNFFSKIYQIKYLFSFTLLLGILFIIYGSVTDKYITTIFFVIAFMLIYFFLGKRNLSSELLTVEQFADTNYYLGFLYTLISLASSLYVLSSNSQESNMLIDLIGQFGISISTTIIGLSLRIYLLSFQPTMDSNVESFNMVVFEKLEMLRDHISETIDQTSFLSEEIDERIKMFTDRTQETMDNYNTRLHETFEKEVIGNIFNKMSENIEKLQTDQAEKYNEIYSNMKNIHQEYESQTVKSMEGLAKLLNNSQLKFDNFFETIQHSNNEVEQHNSEMTKAIRDFHLFVQKLPNVMLEYRDMLNNSNRELLSILSEKNEEMTKNFLQTRNKEHETLVQEILNINKQNQEFNNALSTKYEKLIEEMGPQREKAQKDLLETVVNELTAQNTSLMKTYSDNSEQLLEALKEHNERGLMAKIFGK